MPLGFGITLWAWEQARGNSAGDWRGAPSRPPPPHSPDRHTLSLARAHTPPPPPDPHLGGRHTLGSQSRGSRSGMEAAGTERPTGWPGAPLARTGLLLLSTWVLAGAEITWGAAGGPGRLVSPASRPSALPPLLPRAAVNRWPEELASVRRATALRRRSRLELLPQASGGEIPAEAEETSPEAQRWVRSIPAPSKAGSSRRTRRAQPPSTLERGDAWATAPADGAKGSRPQTKGSREEVKATRTGGPAAEELRLPSTSFALTGDSAHNQAMVHWSGHNSSVSTHLTQIFSLLTAMGNAEWGRGADSCLGSRWRIVEPRLLERGLPCPLHAPNRLAEFCCKMAMASACVH